MNNPINDIPVYTPPVPKLSAADAFEHWLQGRINLCVDGLTSRIYNLEETIYAQRERLELQEKVLNDHIVRLAKLEDGGTIISDEKVETAVRDIIENSAEVERSLKRATESVVDRAIEKYMENWDFNDDLDARAVWSLIEDDVQEALSVSSVVEKCIVDWMDSNLDGKVEDAVKSLTFEVSVS